MSVKIEKEFEHMGLKCAVVFGYCGYGKNTNLVFKYGLVKGENFQIMQALENMFPEEDEVKSLDYCVEECKKLAEQLSVQGLLLPEPAGG